MAMRARPPDLRGDPAAAAALRMLFECGWDYFDDASVHFGVTYSVMRGCASSHAVCGLCMVGNS